MNNKTNMKEQSELPSFHGSTSRRIPMFRAGQVVWYAMELQEHCEGKRLKEVVVLADDGGPEVDVFLGKAFRVAADSLYLSKHDAATTEYAVALEKLSNTRLPDWEFGRALTHLRSMRLYIGGL